MKAVISTFSSTWCCLCFNLSRSLSCFAEVEAPINYDAFSHDLYHGSIAFLHVIDFIQLLEIEGVYLNL